MSEAVMDQTSAATAPDTTSAAPATTQESTTPAPVGGATTETTGGEPQGYAPSFKYKAANQEKEFPEWVRSVVKSKEQEEYLRSLHEKADGLESIKQTRDQIKSENEWYKQNLMPVAQNFQTLSELRNQALQQEMQSPGNGFEGYRKFFEQCGIPTEHLLRYALKEAELRQDPTKKASFDETYKLKSDNERLQREIQASTQAYQNTAVQQAQMMLDWTLQKSDTAPVVQAFDAKFGAGAFKERVINLGKVQPNLSIEQAVTEMTKLLTWNGAPQQAQVSQLDSGNPAQPQAEGTQSTPRVLPNIKGKGTSPTKIVPRSTDDLRKIARQMSGG